MSIVAVKVTDNKIEIASDSILVVGWTQTKSTNTFSKLVRVNGMILGSVGSAKEASLLQLYCSTRKPENITELGILNFISEFSEWKNSKVGDYGISDSHFIIVDSKAFLVEGFFVQEIKDYYAIGAGMDYALSALYLGHNVIDSVKVACELSAFCELPVVHFSTNR